MLRALLVAILPCWWLVACDIDGSNLSRGVPTGANAGVQQDDIDDAWPAGATAVNMNYELRGASADGTDADVAVKYSVASVARDAVTSRTYFDVELVDSAGDVRLLKRVKVDQLEQQGELLVSMPTNDPGNSLRGRLRGLDQSKIVGLPVYSTTGLPDIIKVNDTDLSKLTSLGASLVEGSYSSAVVDGRRIHRFAVEVEGTLEDATDPVAVSGLDKHVGEHFVIKENGVTDSESPVSINYSRTNVAVHLVMDVSGSIVTSRQAHNLLDSVTRTVIALAPHAEFHYRVFSGDSSHIRSLRHLDFDDPSRSATALYYAVDRALVDIEDFGSSEQDKILIAFTDGDDRSSLNKYPAFNDTAQVHEYLQQRLRNVRSAQQRFHNRDLKSYFISFDASAGDVNEQALQQLALAGNGQHYDRVTDGDIQGAFGKVLNQVRGVYYVEYSSQITRQNAEIDLEVRVGEAVQRIELPIQ